jgi:hypothetical protein
VIAGQQQAVGRLKKADVTGGVTGGPDDLEAVRPGHERLAAFEQAIRLQEEAPPVVGVHGLAGRLGLVHGEAVPPEPVRQCVQVGVAGRVGGVDQWSVEGVEPDAGATPLAELGRATEVVGMAVGRDDGVERRDGYAEDGEVGFQGFGAGGDTHAGVDHGVAVVVTD